MIKQCPWKRLIADLLNSSSNNDKRNSSVHVVVSNRIILRNNFPVGRKLQRTVWPIFFLLFAPTRMRFQRHDANQCKRTYVHSRSVSHPASPICATARKINKFFFVHFYRSLFPAPPSWTSPSLVVQCWKPESQTVPGRALSETMFK